MTSQHQIYVVDYYITPTNYNLPHVAQNYCDLNQVYIAVSTKYNDCV